MLAISFSAHNTIEKIIVLHTLTINTKWIVKMQNNIKKVMKERVDLIVRKFTIAQKCQHRKKVEVYYTFVNRVILSKKSCFKTSCFFITFQFLYRVLIQRHILIILNVSSALIFVSDYDIKLFKISLRRQKIAKKSSSL